MFLYPFVIHRLHCREPLFDIPIQKIINEILSVFRNIVPRSIVKVMVQLFDILHDLLSRFAREWDST